ncbi:MAG: bifunctional ornithine acetyltransferase/N-acetylglutamate synthase [Methanothrix sp.]|jgi:glutamate N-acetyltransferase/amino-acid N-acetyltransferase|uniref:bifunctional ornithine acetyltransferase/N-acetylglutamate synthase n=1 Tax=Methanothrix sp. TaxID=90426 RepID=UPI0025F2DF00|nr:bifunctional ornithine acetyltransferase/N-acetylglutamate synthase [Methanothrix sp.]MBK7386227.1 bifunctional ornithine acetyltransferase/N-acetylglutamate synthase [Methanothrix sp.]HPW73805.1 bifunctional ornithine acetyltransferase/N-acetylglutamate synthase [Methanothrix sp.]
MQRVEGGICAIEGVRACGVREGRYGLALIAASGAAAGMFTTNRVRAAPLAVTAEHLTLTGGHLDGIIANSGCANAYTGGQGAKDARDMASLLAGFLKTDEKRIAVASTGVIGRYMDMDLISRLFQEAKGRLRSEAEASLEAERAIMTTDSREKEVAVEHRGLRVAGIVKGAGMIAPHMATMLCFLFTDADLSPEVLKVCLADAVQDSFNMLTVDGDTSTNDTVILTATGRRQARVEDFQEALRYVCTDLARQMARDGEGASRFFETRVTGARSIEDARLAAKAVASSSLVKTAVYGADPNWGRIICALGYSGAEMDPELVTLGLEGSGQRVELVQRGRIAEGGLEKAREIMSGEEIVINIDLGLGTASARSFGCDLTHEYVNVNASYTT